VFVVIDVNSCDDIPWAEAVGYAVGSRKRVQPINLAHYQLNHKTSWEVLKWQHCVCCSCLLLYCADVSFHLQHVLKWQHCVCCSCLLLYCADVSFHLQHVFIPGCDVHGHVAALKGVSHTFELMICLHKGYMESSGQVYAKYVLQSDLDRVVFVVLHVSYGGEFYPL
jgi:hypothetical protein